MAASNRELPRHLVDESKEASTRGDLAPVSQRGIRLDALEGLFEWADQQRAQLNQQAADHSWAYWHLDDPDDRIPPPIEELIPQDQTARDFVRHFGFGLTQNSQSSLHEILKNEYIGPPKTFISYSWDSVLINKADGLIPTVASASAHESYVWIDIVCHNQHIIGPIADQMRAVIARCDSVLVPMMAPWYERVWCIWEVLCAKLEGKPVQFIWAPKLSRRYKVAYRAYVDGFISVREARATYLSDKEAILLLVENAFGTIDEADKYFHSVMAGIDDQ